MPHGGPRSPAHPDPEVRFLFDFLAPFSTPIAAILFDLFFVPLLDLQTTTPMGVLSFRREDLAEDAPAD
jgi:hypothetical protein